MFRSARRPRWLLGLAFAALAFASPALANVTLPTSNIDWAYVASTNSIRFHMHFVNPDAAPTAAGTGVLRPQLYGAFMPDASPAVSFDIGPMPPNGSFDAFANISLAALPPSAVVTPTPPAGAPCAPPTGWNGNVHVTWNTASGQGEAFRHMGRVLICPGAPCTFIHVVTDCAVGAPWSVTGLCAGFHATLYEEDRVTPAPNPVPPAWHGWLCVTADAVVPVPTSCCFALRFDCSGQPGIVELCATTCRCQPAKNPVPGAIDWQTLPGGNTVRFHVRWDNPDSQPSSPIDGQIRSQVFGVFQPDFGPIGSFLVPAVQSNGSFDVFTDVPVSQLPPTAPKSGGPSAAGGPCPPDDHWDGNVDITWTGAAGGGSVNKHIGHVTVCPGSGASQIHVAALACDSTSAIPWTIAGLCPGFHATLVNEDKVTPAANPLPAGWTGYIAVTADASTPVPDSCCIQVLFTCHGVPGVIDLCAYTCNCNPTGGNPVPGTIDWKKQPGTGQVRFHVRWVNPSTSAPSLPVSGDIHSQMFGLFLPDFGDIGHFDVPVIAPNGFFDVFLDADPASLPPEAARQLPGGGPPANSPCPQDTSWAGNVDVTWGGAGGTGTVNKHYGNLLINSAGGASRIHVISGCTLATGTSWTLIGGCSGFSLSLENEDHSPAPALLPAGWTGWLRVAAPGVAPGTSCCFDLVLQCGSQTGTIRVCATTCAWAALGVEPEPETAAFGIRNVMPNPMTRNADVSFAMPKAGLAKIEVYDVTGQRVRTLANGSFAPGLHRVRWDGRDSQGNFARPGTYFVRLSVGAQNAAHMIVLRP